MKPVCRVLPLLLFTLLISACGTETVTRVIRTAEPPPGTLTGRYLAATLPWLDERSDIPVHQVDTADSVLIIPLDEVALPRKIVTIDGRLPGDDGYPLIEWTVAFNPRNGKPDKVALKTGPLEPVKPVFFRIAGVGDIMPGRGFDTLLAGDNGVNKALGDVAPLLTQPDLLIGNLETAVTDASEAVEKSYNFKVPRKSLESLTALGFDFFHLANNHGWDYGEEGFLDTLEAVNSIGVGYSGAGADLHEARFAWETLTPAGGNLRILSLGAYYREGNGFDGASQAAAGEDKPGVLWDSPENEDFIRETLGQDDAFTIVTVHGGYEWVDTPPEDVKLLYRRYVNWGADLVLAHHPHVLQGMELYNDAVIAYSLGNFIFPGMKGWYSGEETGVLEFLLLDGRIAGVEFYPVKIDNTRLHRAEGSGIDTRFREMSRELSSGS